MSFSSSPSHHPFPFTYSLFPEWPMETRLMRIGQSLEENRKEILDTIVRIPRDFRGNFLLPRALSLSFSFLAPRRPLPRPTAHPWIPVFSSTGRPTRNGESQEFAERARGIRYVCRRKRSQFPANEIRAERRDFIVRDRHRGKTGRTVDLLRKLSTVTIHRVAGWRPLLLAC